MKKITVTIKDNSLIFKYRTNKPVQPNLLNTNVISNNELVFSDEYLIANDKIVSLFLCDLVKEKEIEEVVVSNNELGELIIGLLKKLPTINLFTITDNVNLSYELCEKIAKSKNIKKLNCYSIPQFMVENLDKYDVIVDSRNEILFTSNFMATNNFVSFSKMYYKNSIRISNILTNEDIQDIKIFCTINKYLRVIHLETYSLDALKTIIKILKDEKKKNVCIEIHEDIDNPDDILVLKNINKELKDYKLRISLVYSEDYLKSNYLRQVIFTTLKICALIIFAIVGSVLGYVAYNNYTSELKYKETMEEFRHLMSQDTSSGNTNIETDENQMINNYDVLFELNNDMVGWLTINGTKIDYPVLQTTDNSFYLNHNFYKEEDYDGWVFMDYRNDPVEYDDNTILYAHNRYTSGVMFGSLPSIRKDKWHEDKGNYVLTFNSLYGKQSWQIFSYYSIKVTNDYLRTRFKDDTEHQEFIDMITKRSLKDFDVEVTPNDKILTLSTCLNTSNGRFVVHAKLIE